MDPHAHPRHFAGLLLALLLSPLTALAAGPQNVTAALAFPFAGVAHYVPPDRCRALGVGEEDVAFPTDPANLLRVVSTIDFDATEAQVSVYSMLDRITGIGLDSGMPYHARGEAINPIYRPAPPLGDQYPIDPALGAAYPIDPTFVFSPADPARANCVAPLDGHGGLVFFPDGTLNGDRDVGSFFFIGQPGGG